MPQKIEKRLEILPALNSSQKVALISVLVSILLVSIGISFAAENTSRYSAEFKAQDAQIIKGANKNNGVITFDSQTSTTTTQPVNNGGTYESFDRNFYWVTDSWGMPNPGVDEASFRTLCNPSHLGYVDPIVYPGQNGASHLHMFFGNRKTDHNSTATSLKNTGNGSCDGGPLNRTAYWIPAMQNSSSKVVLPQSTVVYYKVDARIKDQVNQLPAGLRMIAGDGMAHSTSQNTARYKFKCVANNGTGNVIFDEQKLMSGCPSNSHLYLNFFFPQCWDGVNLDSANHKSHLTYRDWGTTPCPASHPVMIPQVSLNLTFATGSDNSNNWYLSSDDMSSMGMGKMPGGTTVHADWFFAWDNEVSTTWLNNCLKKVLSCVAGQTGDGRNLKRVPIDYPGPLVVNPPANKTSIVNLPNSGLQ